MRLNFPDDDGFISIVNADKYSSFFNENWHFDQLSQHFVDEIKKQNLIIWKSNESGGDNWDIDVLKTESDKREFRHFTFPINVTANILYLSSYADLTMAAQFKDETIPQKHNSHLKIDIDNGNYEVTVRQMFNPKTANHFNSNWPHFEIIFSKTKSSQQVAAQIFWYE